MALFRMVGHWSALISSSILAISEGKRAIGNRRPEFFRDVHDPLTRFREIFLL